MYKFTKYHEMKQLEELMNEGKIEMAILLESPFFGEDIVQNEIKLEYVSDGHIRALVDPIDKKKGLHSEIIYPSDVNWEETAKLVKEDKMEKVIVRGWEDLGRLICVENFNIDTISIAFDNKEMVLKRAELEKAVNVINALGGNFEYKKAKIIIDTDRLLVSMLINFSNEQIYYDFYNKLFFTNNEASRRENISFDEVEERFNVDLQILK